MTQMTTTSALVTELQNMDPDLLNRIKRLATEKGQGGKWREFVVNFVMTAARAVAGDSDLRPQDVARMLGCSKYTVYRDVRNGVYPNAYWKNSRVCYIPRKDVEAMKVNPAKAAMA